MAEIIKVSATSRSNSVAGAIAGVMRKEGCAEAQAIGASTVNQTVKAIAIAQEYLKQDNIDLGMWAGFVEVDINGNERTALRFYLYDRNIPQEN